MTLWCPECGEREATVLVSIADPDQFTCTDCNADFDKATVEEALADVAKWHKVFAWTALAPREEETPQT